jgi:hypothetical protein
MRSETPKKASTIWWGFSGAPFASFSKRSSAFRRSSVEPGQAAAEDLLDEGLLAAEVVIDRGQVDPGAAGDHAHRGGLEAVLDKQGFGASRMRSRVSGLCGFDSVRLMGKGTLVSNSCLNDTSVSGDVKPGI